MRIATFMSGLMLALVLGQNAYAAAPANTKPNIVFILVDDMGWSDVGCMGSKFYETPNIDRLAGQGMRFTQAYSVGRRSRASLSHPTAFRNRSNVGRENNRGTEIGRSSCSYARRGNKRVRRSASRAIATARNREVSLPTQSGSSAITSRLISNGAVRSGAYLVTFASQCMIQGRLEGRTLPRAHRRFLCEGFYG